MSLPDAPPSRSSTRSSLLKLVVSVSAVALLLSQVDTERLAATLGKIHGNTAIFVLLIYLSGQVVSARRWSVILGAAGFERSFGWVLRTYFGAMFFNLFAPATFGGDAVRTYSLGREGSRHAAAMATVVFDRISGLAALCLLASVSMAVGGAQGWPEIVGWTAAALGFGLILGPGWILPAFLTAVPAAQRLTERFRGPGRELWSSVGLWTRCCAWSLTLHLHQIAAAWVLGQALGLGVPLAYYFVFHPLVIIFGALPISFAGFGVREMGYLWALTELRGVPAEAALAFGLAWSGLLVAASGFGGIVALFGGGDPNGPPPAE